MEATESWVSSRDCKARSRQGGFARSLALHTHRARAAHLEVRLAQDACQLGCGAVLARQVPDVTQDVLHQLHVVVPHRLQLRLLQPLVGLRWGRGTPHCHQRPVHMHAHTHTHACLHAMHAHSALRAHARVQTHPLGCTCKATGVCLCMHTCTHTSPPSCECTQQHTCARASVHTLVDTRDGGANHVLSMRMLGR